MGILDEAIREHLELKRQHGADDSELKQLEDDAFGQADRPGDEESAADPFTEAPTEFMAAPDAGGEGAEVAEGAPPQREAPDIASLQEAPETPVEQLGEEDFEGVEEEAEQLEEEPEPIAEEPTAMEHEVVPEAPESTGPSTDEREVIADQPTEMFDVEAELRETLEAAPAAEPALEEEEEDDFWDEQRLSDELNQALEAPIAEPTEAAEVEEEEEVVEAEVDEDADAEDAPPPIRGDQDVLEDTPDFLEDSEDDQLWFEQKPPKDFDFDD